MAGELVPLVMLPRYSTFAGETIFTTIAMDVTEYQAAILNIWRGRLATDAGFGLTCQESTDQVTWSTCSGTTANYDPGQETEGQQTATIKKRWFRIAVELTSVGPGNPYPQVSCWAVGFLEEREA